VIQECLIHSWEGRGVVFQSIQVPQKEQVCSAGLCAAACCAQQLPDYVGLLHSACFWPYPRDWSDAISWL